jgi:hypothetical protein
MANTIATSTLVLNEVAYGFENSLSFVGNCDMQYSDEFAKQGAKVWNTVNVRLPQLFTATWGQALQVQNVQDSTAALDLNHQVHTDLSWSSAEATTELDAIRDRYINPAVNVLSNAVDAYVFNDVYSDVYHAVGTPGDPPTTGMTYLEAGLKLSDMSVELMDSVVVLDGQAEINIVNTVSSLFNPQAYVASAFKKGQMGNNALSIGKWFRSQNAPAHTTGTYTACTPLVNGANQTGSSLISNGWASGATTLKKGDVFTVAACYSVNPVSKVSTGRLQQFVVTADISDTTGSITIPISPSIVASGAYQNVSGSPANDAAITVLGTTAAAGGTLTTTVSKQSMLFHPEAFAVVYADLFMPSAGCKSTRIGSKARRIAIRMVEQFDINTDQNPTRLDILFGSGTVQPRLACRIFG